MKLEKNSPMFQITDNNTVKVYYEKNDGITIKTITADDLVNILNLSKINVEKKGGELEFKTNLLPHFNTRCIQTKKYKDGREYFVLLRENKPVDFEYFGTVYENVGVPTILFAVVLANNILQGFKIAAVKDKVITEDTQIYYYPFSNVSSPTSYACVGGNRISNIEIKSTSQLHSMPDMFLSMPNSNDSYGHNESGLEYRPLLKKLSNKKFPDKYLKPANMKYSEWFEKI